MNAFKYYDLLILNLYVFMLGGHGKYKTQVVGWNFAGLNFAGWNFAGCEEFFRLIMQI